MCVQVAFVSTLIFIRVISHENHFMLFSTGFFLFSKKQPRRTQRGPCITATRLALQNVLLAPQVVDTAHPFVVKPMVT